MLKKNRGVDENVEKILYLLKKNKFDDCEKVMSDLNELTIDGREHRITKTDFEKLTYVLTKNKSIQKLNLNYIVKEKTRNIFIENRHSKIVSISEKDFLSLLLLGIEKNNTLLQLDLKNNILSKKSVKYLCKYLCNNQTLIELNLSHNRYSNSCLERIINSLIHNKSLIFLYFYFNSFDSYNLNFSVKRETLNKLYQHNCTLLFISPLKLKPCLKVLDRNKQFLTMFFDCIENNDEIGFTTLLNKNVSPFYFNDIEYYNLKIMNGTIFHFILKFERINLLKILIKFIKDKRGVKYFENLKNFLIFQKNPLEDVDTEFICSPFDLAKSKTKKYAWFFDILEIPFYSQNSLNIPDSDDDGEEIEHKFEVSNENILVEEIEIEPNKKKVDIEYNNIKKKYEPNIDKIEDEEENEMIILKNDLERLFTKEKEEEEKFKAVIENKKKLNEKLKLNKNNDEMKVKIQNEQIFDNDNDNKILQEFLNSTKKKEKKVDKGEILFNKNDEMLKKILDDDDFFMKLLKKPLFPKEEEEKLKKKVENEEVKILEKEPKKNEIEEEPKNMDNEEDEDDNILHKRNDSFSVQIEDLKISKKCNKKIENLLNNSLTLKDVFSEINEEEIEKQEEEEEEEEEGEGEGEEEFENVFKEKEEKIMIESEDDDDEEEKGEEEDIFEIEEDENDPKLIIKKNDNNPNSNIKKEENNDTIFNNNNQYKEFEKMVLTIVDKYENGFHTILDIIEKIKENDFTLHDKYQKQFKKIDERLLILKSFNTTRDHETSTNIEKQNEFTQRMIKILNILKYITRKTHNFEKTIEYILEKELKLNVQDYYQKVSKNEKKERKIEKGEVKKEEEQTQIIEEKKDNNILTKKDEMFKDLVDDIIEKAVIKFDDDGNNNDMRIILDRSLDIQSPNKIFSKEVDDLSRTLDTLNKELQDKLKK